ncbi:MAG: AAA family ATPase [Bacteroidales bacterium]|nr:AAA family ATPase [Bacteroidales bacterium]
MITRIEIDGFKTFNNFKMEFTPFTIVAGTNASGKSNLFDALKLLSNLAETDLKTAFNNTNLRGKALEQFSQYANGEFASKIKFAVEVLLDSTITDNWGEKSILKYTRVRYEIEITRKRNTKGFDDLHVIHEVLKPIKHQEDRWVKTHISKHLLEKWRPKVIGRRGTPYIATEQINKKTVIRIPLDGKPGRGKLSIANNISQTLLSSINSVEFPHVFAAKQEMINWRFLQLNPEELSKPSPRIASDVITPSGGNLAAALYRLKIEDDTYLNDISRELNNLLPNFVKVDVTEDVAENRFVIKLNSEDGREFSSRVLSEGTLRLLILCILKYDPKYKGTLCFEEPENGIHPYRINMMLELLKGLSTDLFEKEDTDFPLRQMIVNTHSSVFVGELFIKERFPLNISVWFSKLVTSISIKSSNKFKFKSTKILPVRKGNNQIQFDFITPSELEITDLEVKKYLETKDFEN